MNLPKKLPLLILALGALTPNVHAQAFGIDVGYNRTLSEYSHFCVGVRTDGALSSDFGVTLGFNYLAPSQNIGTYRLEAIKPPFNDTFVESSRDVSGIQFQFQGKWYMYGEYDEGFCFFSTGWWGRSSVYHGRDPGSIQ